MPPVRSSALSGRFAAGLSLAGFRSRRAEVGSEQIPYPRYPVLGCTRARQNGRSPADLPISTGWRAAAPAPPSRSSGSGRRRILRGRGRSAPRDGGALLQKEYEPRVFLVFRGATGDRLVGQVGGAEGICQSLRVGYSGRSEERHFGRLGDREIPIERSKTVPWYEELLESSR